MAEETGWKAGLGCVDVTPTESMDMSGYAARRKPSEGVRDPLCAKALAIEDEAGERGLLLTVDLIGFDRAFADAICASIGEKTGLERRQIVINASHTHGGPVFGSRHLDGPVAAYNETVREKLTEVAVAAVEDLKPARLSTATGVAHFAMNCRRYTPRDVINAPYPRGYADRSVPVLRVEGEDGTLRAALFLYACHNTTLVSDNLQFSSDYAGFAQRYVEEENPGALAMFAQGCGGDVVPYPRGTYELAKLHGESLGAEVCRLLTQEEFQPVNGPLRMVFETVDLPMAGKPTPEKLEALRAKGGHDVQQAERLAKMVEEGAEWPDHYQMPIGMWQFGEDLTMVHLATEVVSDYIPLLERELGPLGLWVLAYCNDYFGYIPSARVHREGGYEARGVIRGYGALVPEVEGAVLKKATELALQVGRRLSEGC